MYKQYPYSDSICRCLAIINNRYIRKGCTITNYYCGRCWKNKRSVFVDIVLLGELEGFFCETVLLRGHPIYNPHASQSYDYTNKSYNNSQSIFVETTPLVKSVPPYMDIVFPRLKHVFYSLCALICSCLGIVFIALTVISIFTHKPKKMLTIFLLLCSITFFYLCSSFMDYALQAYKEFSNTSQYP